MTMTAEQVERYSRNILLPEIGARGQEKLLAGRVLLVGVGGLGSAAGLYLAAAGVGTIGLVDGDSVSLSNLQRQIMHLYVNIRKAKVDSATEMLTALNPDVQIETYGERLTYANSQEILDHYNFIIDGTDNFAAKFLVSDMCHLAGKPYSHAGIMGFTGQTMTVQPGRTACYRCVFNAPPPEDAAAPCEQAGVLGMVPGVLGAIQAAEAIKSLLNLGELLTDRLLVYNALKATSRIVSLKRNPDCPLCGKGFSITGFEKNNGSGAGARDRHSRKHRLNNR